MDFIDYRKSTEKITLGSEEDKPQTNRYRGKKYRDYVEELILEAQKRGDFDNLKGMGKPLNLETHSSVGDRSLAFSLLKSNGYAPREIELANEIRRELERVESRLAKMIHRGKALRTRRLAPFASERRAYNTAVEKTARDYEKALRELNRKIVTLNLIAPPPLHQRMLDVTERVREFREACPLFTV